MDAIITIDLDQRIVLFNAAAEQMFGCPVAEALGQPISRFIPERFRGPHAEHIREFGETGVTDANHQARRDTLWAAHSDGHEFQIEASISQNVAGGKKLYTVIIRDITERAQILTELQTNEEMLRLLLDGVKDYAVFMLDAEGRVATWNAGAAHQGL